MSRELSSRPPYTKSWSGTAGILFNNSIQVDLRNADSPLQDYVRTGPSIISFPFNGLNYYAGKEPLLFSEKWPNSSTWILDLDDERCSGTHACVLGEIEGSLDGQDISVLSFSPAIILIQEGVEHTVLDDEEWDAKNGRVDYSMCTTHVLPRPFHPKSCSLKFTAVCRYAWWSSAWL